MSSNKGNNALEPVKENDANEGNINVNLDSEKGVKNLNDQAYISTVGGKPNASVPQ